MMNENQFVLTCLVLKLVTSVIKQQGTGHVTLDLLTVQGVHTCSIFDHCDLALSLFYMSAYTRKSMFGSMFAFESFYCVYAVCAFDWSS